MASTELGKTYDINTFLYTLFQKKSSAANWCRILKQRFKNIANEYMRVNIDNAHFWFGDAKT